MKKTTDYVGVSYQKKSTGRGTTKLVYFDQMDTVLGNRPATSWQHTYINYISNITGGKRTRIISRLFTDQPTANAHVIYNSG